jgi:hypothetical protein
MKPLRSIPILLTVLVVAIVIALPPPPLLPISAYSDESETSADQENKQKNVGSGNSFNNNCAENLIRAGVDDNCDKEPPEEEPPEQSATLTVCKESTIENAPPISFTFTVEGNNPDPDEFNPDSDGCVDVAIGPGEFAVTEVAPGGLAPAVLIEDGCVQDPLNPQRATGVIEAGAQVRCIFINSPGGG